MRPDSTVVSRRKKDTKTHRRASVVGIRCHRSVCNKTRTDSRVVPRQKTVTNTHRRADAVACRCHLSACTKPRPGSSVVPQRKKGTNTQRRVSAVGCCCHRSACTKTRPDSRVVPRRKKFDKHPAPRGRGSIKLTSFRVHQDTTGQQGSALMEKVTNTHRRADAVGCRCHRSACTKTQPDSRVGAWTETGYVHSPSRDLGRLLLSSIRVHQDADGQQSTASKEKSDEHPPPSGCGKMSLSSFRVHQDATGQQSIPSTE
ncbi:hypothetical protein TNCV_1573701 [Trichonephila clavipes]|nr:hypothetical protein TNCV_1573701 [Trichonephila clavipes]